MSDNSKVDIIIFGASGYTGKYVVKEFIFANNENQYTWAIAGRNLEKLQEVLKWASVKTGQDVTKTPIIISDCKDEASVNKMAQSGRVIINCCGPYRFYGEVVVKACIKHGTHQVDLAAEVEVEYMETILLNYQKAAEEKGVYIVSGCGFESVPWDLGVIHFIDNFPGQVNTIQTFLKAVTDRNEPLVNYGTWDSVVYGLGNYRNLAPLREKLYSVLKPPKLKPRMKYKPLIHRCDLFDNNLTLPFFKSHQSTVFRTQMYLRDYYGQRPVQYYAYYSCRTFRHFLAIILVALFLILFTQFNWGRRLLLRYPGFFSCGLSSKKGPSEAGNLNATIYYKFKGKGWTKDIADRYGNKSDIDVPHNKKMVTELTFFDGYRFTSRAIIYSAFTILQESDRMPSRGGVLTPGGAFSKTSFLDRLLKNDVSIKIVNES